MKNLKLTLIFLFFTIIGTSQTPIPQPLPCVPMTSTTVNFFGNLIEAYECLQTFGTVVFDVTENTVVRAGEYLSFSGETSISTDNTSLFHAYIEEKQLEIAWFYPQASPGFVGQFDKMEIGVNFPDDINNEINNFINTGIGTELNPFNPEDIDLYAEFWYFVDGVGWSGPLKNNGFFYQEFIRNTTDWTNDSTEYEFRIRFAPRLTGVWRCRVSAVVEGYGVLTAKDFTFDCVPSTKKDFMRVGDNKHYFRVGDEPFFPVGHNLSWPRIDLPTDTAGTWSQLFTIVPPHYFRTYHKMMDTIKMKGGNYFRFINAPWATEIEHEKLGNYYDRMTHAWEMDKILEHADELDLKMHYNMAIHYTFEAPTGLAKRWDYSAYVDNSPLLACAPFNDSGYCYRKDLGIIDPKEFFTDLLAMKHYKNRLRYMVARWGYSNDIAVMELMSEVSNVATNGHIEDAYVVDTLTGDSTIFCKYIGPLSFRPYRDDPTSFCPIIYEWQNEMCRYIKEDLGHFDHPLAVNYGEPTDILSGDFSFFSDYVDIPTWNFYQLRIAKYAENYNSLKVETGLPGLASSVFIDKPMMHSEYGPGEKIKNCDNGTRFKKILTLTPFCGVAGAAMYWDYQNAGQTQLWGHMGIMNNFMQGIKLDEENWRAMPPIVSLNKAVEVLYLRNFVDDNYRACGVISNRTYNYFTQSTGSPCNDEEFSSELEEPGSSIYLDTTAYAGAVASQTLHISEMGTADQYRVNWYNAFTGDFILTTNVTTSEPGLLPLYFPTITGDETQPILFFEVYRTDEPSFKTPVQNPGVASNNYESKLEEDSNINSIEATMWSSLGIKDTVQQNPSDLVSILIAPNPTKGNISISVNLDEIEKTKWFLVDASGALKISGNLTETNFELNLSVYADGNYYFILEHKNKRYVTKVIKL